ncbi:unnamed protein product [Nezara viridula]|uniref:Uncharacterized protein n=1 Tax=Nezara viridula TaxID=85310 RepID=A0A9P0HA26_NEZVI|nr:unnamed protein product [Nezara viridula]
MIICLLEVIGFSKRIPLQLTSSGQLSSGCKRKYQSSSLPRIDPQEALISTHYISFGPNRKGWHATEHTLTWKASNNLWSEQLSAFLKKHCVLLLMTGHGY